MPIDLVIDERDGGKSELGVGDSNNNANRSTADSTSHTTEGSSSTPDMVSTKIFGDLQKYLLLYFTRHTTTSVDAFCFVVDSFIRNTHSLVRQSKATTLNE